MRQRHGFRPPTTLRFRLRPKCARRQVHTGLPEFLAIWAAAAQAIPKGKRRELKEDQERPAENPPEPAAPTPTEAPGPPRDPVFGNWGGPLSPLETIVEETLKEKFPKHYEWIMARARQRLNPSPDIAG